MRHVAAAEPDCNAIAICDHRGIADHFRIPGLFARDYHRKFLPSHAVARARQAHAGAFRCGRAPCTASSNIRARPTPPARPIHSSRTSRIRRVPKSDWRAAWSNSRHLVTSRRPAAAAARDPGPDKTCRSSRPLESRRDRPRRAHPSYRRAQREARAVRCAAIDGRCGNARDQSPPGCQPGNNTGCRCRLRSPTHSLRSHCLPKCPGRGTGSCPLCSTLLRRPTRRVPYARFSRRSPRRNCSTRRPAG